MVDAITLVTVALISFAVSALAKNFYLGAFSVLIFQIIWYEYFSSFFTVDIGTYLIQSTALIILYSFAGGAVSYAFGYISVLDPFYTYSIGKEKDSVIGYKDSFFLFAKAVIVIILLICAHIPIEFDDWTPLWQPSLTTALFVPTVYVIAYCLFTIGMNQEIFQKGQSELKTFIITMGGIHTGILVAWLIFHSFSIFNTFFIVNQWNFYLLLILGGAVIVTMVIVKYMWLNDNYTEVEQ